MNELKIILSQIEKKNPIHAKKIRKVFNKQSPEYINKAEAFFKNYAEFANECGRSLEYGIESYLKMLSDVTQEYLYFIKTGEYSTKTFEDANERVYNNPEVMEYYMHGLLVSQYLWVHHNDIFNFFKKHIPEYKGKVKNYLEIGAGHGMYISEAINTFESNVVFDVVDLSPTSIKLSKSFIKNDKVNYNLVDIYEYSPEDKYDFITMGEVLEHVEDPVRLLKRIKTMLHPDGCLFMTTPANAPAIDHIYLFKNAQDIRDVVEESGFEIVTEYAEYVEDVSKEIAEKHKITLMYGAYLKIKTK